MSTRRFAERDYKNIVQWHTFLHFRSPEPHALPLIIAHGWPARSWSS